jgi:hypothetical protein
MLSKLYFHETIRSFKRGNIGFKKLDQSNLFFLYNYIKQDLNQFLQNLIKIED